MENFYETLNKFFKIIPGGIFGLASTVVALICDIIAISLYPGYNIFYDMVSNLGVGPGATFFNFGLIFSGFTAVILYLYIGVTFYDESSNKKLIKIAVIISIISSMLMALIGILPAVQSLFTIVFLHYITALLTWLTGIIYCSIFGYLIIKSSKYSNIISIFAFIPAFMMLVLLIFIVNPFMKNLVPLTEWIMVFSVILWALVISLYTLYKKI